VSEDFVIDTSVVMSWCFKDETDMPMWFWISLRRPQLLLPQSGHWKLEMFCWSLTGPSPIANNLKDPNTIGISQTTVSIKKDSYYLQMPACSIAAIEIKP
jgi:hypothetical protein